MEKTVLLPWSSEKLTGRRKKINQNFTSLATRSASDQGVSGLFQTHSFLLATHSEGLQTAHFLRHSVSSALAVWLCAPPVESSSCGKHSGWLLPSWERQRDRLVYVTRISLTDSAYLVLLAHDPSQLKSHLVMLLKMWFLREHSLSLKYWGF